MSYYEKPQIKLYKYENSSFVLQAIIDDYQEVSFEHNLFQAGSFTITINYNIPNALLFERGLFVQFGNHPYDFGEILTIQDSIGEDGKGSQTRTITGYDARYILKRRVIKNMNSNGLWVMTAKGELCIRNLIKDQCGSGAEAKRQLPISNTIPSTSSAIGKEYSVSEQFSNLYEVCKTIATQSEIGWRMAFDGEGLTLECYTGTDRSQTVQFSTGFDSLANGEFSDSSESFSNAIYIGGKGQNDDRDIYEGENGTPSGLDRFESWDNQSSMTTESEYEAEALSMLTQYGQTLTMSGNGLAKCPYIFREQYDIGDIIKVAFSGKSATAQILSVTEHWTWGAYDIQFSFGKPQNNLADQLQLMLRQIQKASEKASSTDSVRWYTIPTDTAMPKSDVTYRTIGFVGNCAEAGSTFTLYLDDEATGAKTYHVYFKQLGGGKLTLTTGKTGASNLTLNSGTYVAIIYVDENGNITNTASTPTNTIQTGNTQPATSESVANYKTSSVTSESDLPVTSRAVNTALLKYGYSYRLAKSMTFSSTGWKRIAQFSVDSGQCGSISLSKGYNFNRTCSVEAFFTLEFTNMTEPQNKGNIQIVSASMGSSYFQRFRITMSPTSITTRYLEVYIDDTRQETITLQINSIRPLTLKEFEDVTDSPLEVTSVYIKNPIPPAPTTNGNYNLQCTISNGVPSYIWNKENLYTFPYSSSIRTFEVLLLQHNTSVLVNAIALKHIAITYVAPDSIISQNTYIVGNAGIDIIKIDNTHFQITISAYRGVAFLFSEPVQVTQIS